jgi:hypothetical protein
MRNALIALGALFLLAGCGGMRHSDPYASPDTSTKADCEAAGGYWHSIPAVCETPTYRR